MDYAECVRSCVPHTRTPDVDELKQRLKYSVCAFHLVQYVPETGVVVNICNCNIAGYFLLRYTENLPNEMSGTAMVFRIYGLADVFSCLYIYIYIYAYSTTC